MFCSFEFVLTFQGKISSKIQFLLVNLISYLTHTQTQEILQNSGGSWPRVTKFLDVWVGQTRGQTQTRPRPRVFSSDPLNTIQE